jgi:hypothetical protein
MSHTVDVELPGVHRLGYRGLQRPIKRPDRKYRSDAPMTSCCLLATSAVILRIPQWAGVIHR